MEKQFSRVLSADNISGLSSVTQTADVGISTSRDLLVVIPPDDRGEIVDQVRNLFTEYLDPPFAEIGDLLTVWAVGTHCFETFNAYPQLVLQGAKGAGKSRCLKLLNRVCARPELLVAPSSPSMFRLIAGQSPTLLVDEAESLVRARGDGGQICKAGYTREGVVARVGPNGVVERFSIYCPKALASTVDLDHIVGDRSFTLAMKRSSRDLGDLDSAKLEQACVVVRERIGALFPENVEKIRKALEVEQEESSLRGRQRELWLPMLTLARFLGGQALWDRVNDCRERLHREKRAREFDDNPHVELLIAVETFLDEAEPILNRHGAPTAWYPARAVVAHVKPRVDHRWTQSKLSRALRTLGVIDGANADKCQKWLSSDHSRIDTHGQQVMCYRLVRERVAEALEVQLDEVA